MVGRPSWATTAPSTNSTIEWMSCCGWTTTSMRSKGMSKSRCASITSRPLLTSVAELVVITRPIAKLGWASACSGVTSASSSAAAPAERAAGRGEHEAAYLLGGAGAQALRDGAVLGVDRHDLARPGALLDQRAADDQRLLVGQGERGAGVEGGEGGAQADGAGDAVEHDVARPARRPRWRPPRPARRTPARTPRPGRRTAPGCDPPAVRPTTRNRSGLARTRSSAWVPMDPVEPRITMSRTVTPAVCQDGPRGQRRGGLAGARPRRARSSTCAATSRPSSASATC